LTAADVASSHGLRVTVVDAGTIGGGASGRNAAGVAPVWGAQTPDGAIGVLGTDRAAILNAALAASSAKLFARARSLSVDCSIREGGFLTLAAKKETAASLPSLAEQWRRAGMDVTVLDKSLAHYVDSPRYVGGLLFAAGGTLNPLAYAKGLALACEERGARIFENSLVTAVMRQTDGRWLIKSAGRVINAATVIVAVNGAAGLGYDLDRIGLRIECQLLGSAPMSERQWSALPRCPTFADLDDASIFGGTVAADGRFVTTVLPGPRPFSLSEAGDMIAGKFARAFPSFGKPDWRSIDSGHILVTANKLPQLFELGPGFYAGQGCNGYGLCAGTLLGEDLARLALIRDDMPRRFLLEQPRATPFSRIVTSLIKRVMPLARRFS
jgi:glycine/D-amino acid oxidase-like deaminating enzyme